MKCGGEKEEEEGERCGGDRDLVRIAAESLSLKRLVRGRALW